MKKINYNLGTIFSLPLKDGGFGVGIVAKVSKNKKGIILSYFSNKRFDNIPTLKEVQDLTDFPYAWRIGDLSLINEDWNIVGQKDNFKSEDWPMPLFIRKDPFSNKAWEVKYKEDDVQSVQSETLTESNRKDIEIDSLKGAGAVEVKLSNLLKSNRSRCINYKQQNLSQKSCGAMSQKVPTRDTPQWMV